MTKHVNKRRENPNDVWVSPFHAKYARGMERDYPRDDYGRPIKHLGRVLKVDPRPEIMRPQRPVYRDHVNS